MRKMTVVLFALICCMVAAGNAFAAQTRGQIVSVDATSPAMVIKEDSGATLTLTITPKTDIQKGMKDLDLTLLAPGTIVIVRYDVKAGKNVARYIGYESGQLQRFAQPAKKEK